MSQIQALDRTQMALPMQPGPAERRTHDCVRHDTTRPRCSPHLDVAMGKVTAAVKPRHRHQEFLAFLKQVARAYPNDVDENGRAASGAGQLRDSQEGRDPATGWRRTSASKPTSLPRWNGSAQHHRLRATFGDHVRDPGCTIGRHMGDAGAMLDPEGREEAGRVREPVWQHPVARHRTSPGSAPHCCPVSGSIPAIASHAVTDGHGFPANPETADVRSDTRPAGTRDWCRLAFTKTS